MRAVGVNDRARFGRVASGFLLAIALNAADLPPDTVLVPPSGWQFERLSPVAIPPYQAWRREDGAYAVLSRDEVFAELEEISGLRFAVAGTPLAGPRPFISCPREVYSVVDHRWFENLVRLAHAELTHHGITFRRDYWDCDDYCVTLGALANLALLQVAGRSRPPPLLYGIMVVRQTDVPKDHPTGGVHAMVIFRSERSWWVVDPQNVRLSLLGAYPYRGSIREILLR